MSNHTIILWNVKLGTPFKILNGHTGPVHSVVFSQDGDILVSASEDQKIKLWSLVPYHEPKTSAALIAEIKACFSRTL